MSSTILVDEVEATLSSACSFNLRRLSRVHDGSPRTAVHEEDDTLAAETLAAETVVAETVVAETVTAETVVRETADTTVGATTKDPVV